MRGAFTTGLNAISEHSTRAPHRFSVTGIQRQSPISPLRFQPLLQRKTNCACGGDCPGCLDHEQTRNVQTKLQVSTPGDQYEREADQVAEQVMRMPESTRVSVPEIIRGDDLNVARRSTRGLSHSDDVPPAVHDVLRSAGAPLETSTRAFMEPRFGRDFGHVRVHTDYESAASVSKLEARAYTIGSHIVFGPGEYEPSSSEGRQLLAHELTHVEQQRDGQERAGAGVYSLTSVMPESNAVADVAHSAAATPHVSKTGLQVQRQTRNHCRQPIRRATTMAAYMHLLRQAETRLRLAGWSSERVVHGITSIYYGTSYSRDYEVENSEIRNRLFSQFTGRTFEEPNPSGGEYTAQDDPRALLGCGLYYSLRDSQDVQGVDMGHALIGMDARMREQPRTQEQTVDPATLHWGAAVLSWLGGGVPAIPTRATGLEAVTWVGDLGGATARLAGDRLHAGSARAGDVDRYFRPGGTDYGAPGNLEGDVLAYSAGRTLPGPGRGTGPPVATLEESGWGMGRPSRPAWQPETPLADTLGYATTTGWANRCAHLLSAVGATGPAASGTGNTITNRSQVLTNMVTPLEGFGSAYVRGPHGAGPDAIPYLHNAAIDVANRFIDLLLQCATPSAQGARPSARHTGAGTLGRSPR
jgi:hypothetical protein